MQSQTMQDNGEDGSKIRFGTTSREVHDYVDENLSAGGMSTSSARPAGNTVSVGFKLFHLRKASEYTT